MDPQSLTILVGAFQRILSILIGGMLIYFGYRLFLSLPGKRGRDGGSGEFSLGGANKVKLSKVGPGVFFAVFGAGLIAYSFAKRTKFPTRRKCAKCRHWCCRHSRLQLRRCGFCS